ncbi:unnamed protein product [Sphagnum jensenii]
MPLPCPNAKIVYKDKTYDPEEFRAHLKTLPVQEMAKYIPSVKSIPSAPFEKTWHEMALRRILKMAADRGYDGVSWTPGEDQNKRYSLSHQVDKIAVPKVDVDGSRSVRIEPIGGGADFKMMVSPDGTVEGYYHASQFSGKKLDEVVGKEMAERIMAAKEPTEFEGKGLDVGGSGMRGFYDKIVPDYLNKFGKKYGAKVGETTIGTGTPTSGEGWSQQDMWTALKQDGRLGKMPIYAIFDRGGNWIGTTGDPSSVEDSGGLETAVKVADENGNLLKDAKLPSKNKTVQYLPITPEMRQSVGEQGVPLFNRTILKEERPDAPDTKAKREELQKRYTQLAQDMKRLDSDGDVWRDIIFDYGKYSKEEREAAWEEKKKARDEWWQKLSEHRKVESELKKMDDPRIGELREDSSGRKTLWLSKDAMWVVQYGARPGITNAFTQLQGVSFDAKEIPKLISNIDKHFGPSSNHVAIIPQIKKLLTEAANQSGKEGVTIVGAKGRGINATAKTAREEMNHAWQRETSAEGSIGSHLKPDAFEELNTKIPTGALEYLRSNGYSDDPVTNVVETAAKLISGYGKELKVSPAEEAYWLHDYFQSVIDEHGTEAFNTLNRVMGVAKQLKEEALNGKEGKFNVSKRAADKGTLGSQSEGGSEGDSGGAGEQEALFNREQVKTPEFKKFFEGSKAVDDEGEPLVVYHGTDANFHTFGQGYDDAQYFSTSPEIASAYSTGNSRGEDPKPNVMPVYVNIRNPKVITEDDLTEMIGPSDDRDWTAMEGLVADAKKEGYDGIHLSGIKDYGHDNQDQWITFDPKQIKSAIGNNGKFDPADPSILRNREKVTKSEDFKNWFGDWEDKDAYSSKRDENKPLVSMAVNKDGTPRVFYHGTQGNFDTFEANRPTKNTGMMGIPYDATRAGIFFATDPKHTMDWMRDWDRRGNDKVAKDSKTIPVYLNIKAPLDLDGRILGGVNAFDDDVREEFAKEGINPRWWNSVQHSWELFDDEDGKKFVEAAKKLGYDGAVIKEDDLDGNSQDVWVAFDPNQIKSAIGNSGKFDASDPSILRNREKGPDADEESPSAAGQSSVESNTDSKESAEKTPEPVDRSSTGTAPNTVDVPGLGKVKIDEKNSMYFAYLGGKNIATASLSDDGTYFVSVTVDPDYRRKGVATALYGFVEKHIGHPLRPSPNYQSEGAKKLWEKRTGNIPIQGGGQLTGAPVMIPPVPIPQKKALPLAEIKAQAAGLNPHHTQVKSVRQLMAEARIRMIP